MSGERKSNRRDFIRGKSLARELEQKLEFDESHQTADSLPSEVAERRQDHYLQQFTKAAMACQFELLFNMGQFENAADVAIQAFELVDQLEAQMTVYRDDSEVSEINRSAAVGAQSVESGLLGLLQTAVGIFELTSGAFDITAGPLSKIWGFEQRSGRVPEQREIDKVLETVGCKNLQIDSVSSTVRFSNSATRINLGGIGKGFAIDRVARFVLEQGITDFVIHGGQSSVKSFGVQSSSSTGDRHTAGWMVGLSHPSIPGKRIGEFCLKNQALGTSGTGRQGFFHNGQRYGHIIDPRTGWPTQHILSSTVVTDSAARADALATAFFVMSLSEVQRFCDAHPDVKSILVVPGAKSGQVQIESFNFDDTEWQPA